MPVAAKTGSAPEESRASGLEATLIGSAPAGRRSGDETLLVDGLAAVHAPTVSAGVDPSERRRDRGKLGVEVVEFVEHLATTGELLPDLRWILRRRAVEIDRSTSVDRRALFVLSTFWAARNLSRSSVSWARWRFRSMVDLLGRW